MNRSQEAGNASRPLAVPVILVMISATHLAYVPLAELQTLPVALSQFTDVDGTPFFSLQMAATTLSIIPVVIVFLFAQRYIVEGIARSGIKG